MKRVANYRLVFYLALALSAGVLVGGSILHSLVLTVSVPIASVAIGFLLFLFFRKHTVWMLFLTFAIGCALFTADHALYKREISGAQTFEVSVESVNNVSGLVLLSSDDFDGYMFFYDEETLLAAGDRIVATGEVTTHDFSYDRSDRYRYGKRMFYELQPETIAFLRHDPDFFQRIRLKSAEVMSRHMSAEETGFCMSLLFGDKSFLSEELSDQITASGLSHVFAVSGLHIGFLAAALGLLLKKLTLPPQFRIPLGFVILFAYATITGFPAGAKRCLIAWTFYSVAPLFRRKSDPLTALSGAVIFLLFCDPREIYDVGFQLSVGAVLGILCFFAPLAFTLPYPLRRLRFRMTEREDQTFFYFRCLSALSLSANVFILPVILESGVIAVYFLPANLFVLPLVTLLFPVLFAIAFFSFFFDGLGALYFLIKYPILFIELLTDWISRLPGASINLPGMGVVALFYLLFFVSQSPFLQLPGKIRFSLSVSFAAATGITAVVISLI